MPPRTRNQALWEQAEARDLYRHRLEIERVNGQLKSRPLRLAEVPPLHRGVHRLLRLCLGKVILYNFALNETVAKARPIRQIKQLVA